MKIYNTNGQTLGIGATGPTGPSGPSGSTGVPGTGYGNLDGGVATSTYEGVTPINAGGAS